MTTDEYLRGEHRARFVFKLSAALAAVAVIFGLLVLPGCVCELEKKEPVFGESEPRLVVDHIGDVWHDKIVRMTDTKTGVVCYIVTPWDSDAGRAILCLPSNEAARPMGKD